MNRKFTITDFKKAKENNNKIKILTAYDYPTAKIIDNASIDVVLVGDSLGMVVLGYEDTTKVTMEDMIHHLKAVRRGVENAFVIADMPFATYHTGQYESVKNAARLVREGGCNAVKIEGSEGITESIKAIINAGIPVMGHLGYTPQSVNVFGGHIAQGKTLDKALKIYEDAYALQKLGVFSIVLECVPFKLAGFITERLNIPIIGIGSGSKCDGQVLVISDLIGTDKSFTPKHAKKYLELDELISTAVGEYIDDIDNETFPEEKHSYIIEKDVMEKLEERYGSI